ncbi:MoaF-related domain-containing protein [uncultured Allomuricauda sp.]|uniref:MoaF-related domain-containing protein n=1 Tax=Flagellimonas sp. W118 TaxID=3410791 RepID=UPI00260466ED|nr:MoaF N-terminal domain-containing protein [uncultured Allomuricauda sp.]
MRTIQFLCLFAFGFASFLQAQNSLDKEEHLLNGTSFTFQYQNAGAIDISFENDNMTYKWLNGRNMDQPAKTYPYKSKKVDFGIYLINWHESDTKNFVTMVYNFNSNSCAVSVLSKYTSENPFLGFQSGVIEHVTKNKE